MKSTISQETKDLVYQRLLRDPHGWNSFGDALWHSAQSVRSDAEFVYSCIPFMDIERFQQRNIPINVVHVWALLAGLSFELYLKSAIIDKIKPKTELILPTEIKSHNLVALANHARMSLSDKETYMLRMFSKSILWQGRYPIPTNSAFEWDGMYDKEHFELADHFHARIHNLAKNN